MKNTLYAALVMNKPLVSALALATAFAVAQPAHAQSMFDQGLQDRTAWEQWFNGLQGDYKTGAFFWAGQRSLPHPGSCQQMSAPFYAGCTQAKVKLSSSDALRKSEPDYKAGWNAWTPSEPNAALPSTHTIPPISQAKAEAAACLTTEYWAGSLQAEAMDNCFNKTFQWRTACSHDGAAPATCGGGLELREMVRGIFRPAQTATVEPPKPAAEAKPAAPPASEAKPAAPTTVVVNVSVPAAPAPAPVAQYEPVAIPPVTPHKTTAMPAPAAPPAPVPEPNFEVTHNDGVQVAAPEPPTPVATRPVEPAAHPAPASVAPVAAPVTTDDTEQAFIKAVKEARDEYSSGGNEMAKGAARVHRAETVCRALHAVHLQADGTFVPLTTVHAWTGSVAKLSSNSDGKGVLAITIAPDVTIETTNNSFSDMFEHTLIEPTSPVYRQAVALHEGQKVTFSGTFFTTEADCAHEESLTQEGSMTEPEYIFKFSDVTPG